MSRPLSPSFSEYPLIAYSLGRSLLFLTEYELINAIVRWVPGTTPRNHRWNDTVLKKIRSEVLELFKKDAHEISLGTYPKSVLAPESGWQHLKRIPQLAWDIARISRRRKQGKTTEFSREARSLLNELPRYFRRNFHFQTDGYLSDFSAKMYEHQVELLFLGAADAMRRLLLPPLVAYARERGLRNLKILEVGAGTGRATRFVKLALPESRITVTDLSPAYVKQAARMLGVGDRMGYLEEDASRLSFKDAQFDAVYSVFLHHELPEEVRRAAISECARVLKPGGFFALVDSMQLGDSPDFDPFLEQFPGDFHEPFYRNYISLPLKPLLEGAGIEQVQQGYGFLSQVLHGIKSPTRPC